MPNALNTLKKISFNVWLYCGVLILLVLWFVGYINRQPTESEIASRATRHYEEHYNKVQPNEKVPYIDSKLYGGIKRDGRYFAIPKEYAGGGGFHFYWPLGIYEKEFRNLRDPNNRLAIDKMNKAAITVFMDSKAKDYTKPSAPRFDLAKKESCYEPIGASKRWNGLIIWARFDDSHVKDWPQICLEIVRILNQIKEVKP